MDDLISRQAAIDALNDEFTITGKANAVIVQDYIRRVNNRLHDLPSCSPDQRWIPVSEMLPYMWDERYLVSLAWGGIGVMEYKSTGFHNYGSFTPVPIESITAWMPLPATYREEN